MTDRELMQQALEALEYPGPSWPEARQKAATALRERLAQPEQEDEIEALNAELLAALKDAAECVQDSYLPQNCGHDWDDVIAKAEARGNK